MCEMNKNHLLSLFFHEGTEREEKKIRNHVSQCTQCQEYLTVLEQTHDRLHRWPDEKPRTDTLDQIMKNIPEPLVKQAAKKPASSLVPLLWIPLSALVMLATILLAKDIVTRLPLWHAIENLWIVQQLGSFGVTALLAFLVGITITLALTPILIFESRSKQYGYRFK